MTQGQPIDERPTSELARVVLDLFGVSISNASEAWEGEESIGWRGSSPDGDRFVQRLPVWRDVGELAWCDSVARAASTAAPTCIRAVRSRDGEVAIRTAEGPVMVFPFVKGAHDWFDGIDLEAAELLAKIHRGIATSWVATGSPPRRSWVRSGGEDLLADEELDRWERMASGSAVLPIHGDYYRGNLLTADGRISGVIDWFDAHVAAHEQEVAWAAWEFCQNDEGEDLRAAEAEAFLQRYLDDGGTAAVAKPFDPYPWIRVRLRVEARAWFSDPRSEAEFSTYHARQLVAFERLRDRHLPGR